MSKLYLRATTDNTGGYVGTELSTALPVGTFDDAGNGARDLETTKGTSQTSVTNTSLGQVEHQDQYMGEWISDPLTVSTIDAETWTLAIASTEQHANGNAFTVASIYVLKSTTRFRATSTTPTLHSGARIRPPSGAGSR
ncbi:MAG TPA: hypothetical protein VM848_16855 [Acidimicrobiia bacterium]|nr:hypothetical protein [Acidimicrobiia bacterium]